MVKLPITHRLLAAMSGVALAVPVAARDKPAAPVASLAIEPVIALDLLTPATSGTEQNPLRLSPVDAERAGLIAPPPYRLEREGDTVTGKRARLSVAVGETTVFAVGGKLSRRAGPAQPDALDQANVVASRKLDSGRLYGGGVERRLGAVDVSASYQFSRISSDQPDLRTGDRAKSHSLHLRARLRF